MLFVYPALNNERHNSSERVQNAMPPALVSDIDALLVYEKIKLILSCWNSNFLPDWIGLYVNTVYFVTSMYRCRAAENYDLMDNVTCSCMQRLGRKSATLTYSGGVKQHNASLKLSHKDGIFCIYVYSILHEPYCDIV